MNKQQLASKIWAAANEMRSKIEASEYKDYILGFIFYKFLSEREEDYLRKQGATIEDIKELKIVQEVANQIITDDPKLEKEKNIRLKKLVESKFTSRIEI